MVVLLVKKFYGVGFVMVVKMEWLGILIGVDLCDKLFEFLYVYFGKLGDWYYYILCGIDYCLVELYWEWKLIGVEDIFFEDIFDVEFVR